MNADKARYVQSLLDRYRKLPGTRGNILRIDRSTADELFEQGVALDLVCQAFLLATARRTDDEGAQHEALQTIRTLRYFLPVIQEVIEEPPDPAYLRYLRHRLRGVCLELG